MLLLSALLSLQVVKHVDSAPVHEARGALQEDWFTRALNYMSSNPETLEEMMTVSHAVLEGDMVLPSDRNAVGSMWPTLEIPYIISHDLAGRTDDILAAMAMVSEHTCISFHKKTSETNYLLFIPSKGCASYVGFMGGEQLVFIGPPCMVGNIAHEVLHALGFHHEHTRTDREQHVTIISNNIMAGMERNFRKHPGQTFDLQYDMSSIMHYGSGFFSANGLPTIIPNRDVRDMGQREKLTESDVSRVRLLYSCDLPQKEEKEKMEEKMKEEEEQEEQSDLLLGDVASTVNRGHPSSIRPSTDRTPQTASAQHL